MTKRRGPEVSVSFEGARMRLVEYDDDGAGSASLRSLEVTVRPDPTCGECGRRGYHLVRCSQHPNRLGRHR